MRPDMKEVIIEKPRRQRMKYRTVRRSQKHTAPNFEGIRKPYGYDRKYPNDILGPLYGYLRSKIGQPWDEVWSDICKVNDKRSVIGSHLRDHILNHMVTTTGVEIKPNGMVYKTLGRWYQDYRLINEFYVHPDTGLLCFAPAYQKKYIPPKSKIVRMHGLEFYEYEGVWYEVVSRPIPHWSKSDRWTVPDKDAFGNYLSSWSSDTKTCFQAYNESVYIVSKKQVGKRMIKKIKEYVQTQRT